MKTPLLLIVFFCLSDATTHAQTHSQTTAPTPTRSPGPANHPSNYRDQLFAAYAHALPGLYEKKDFDSISYYIQQRWQQPRPDPDVFCLAILLSIQRHQFSLTDFSDNDPLNKKFAAMLQAYANAVDPFLQYKDPLRYHSHRGFDASAADREIFFTATRWAADLLKTHSLDSVETFLCQTIAGRIRFPEYALWEGNMSPDQPQYPDQPQSSGQPPAASANQAPPPHGIFRSSQDPSTPVRKHNFAPILVAGTGIWVPGGHLSTLGVHPAVDYGFGIRNHLNQFDLFASLRFINAPNSYTLIRSDSLYSRNFYRGGYVGFDYTRYLFYSHRLETGLIAGIGVDFFDVSDQNDSYLAPTELTIVNYNVGIRCNYFISPRTFIGVAAKYHFLNYQNPGGTPLDGNAFTIDFTIGFTSLRR